jgi:MinD-like ATPase involved in chromosome partitioning or flagellar assembly
MSKVIGVMSFKGGVGKSVSAINLAAGLAKLGRKVVVVDGNFLSPNLHLYLGLLKPQKTLKEVIRDKVDFRNAIYEHSSGVHLLPCSFYKGVDFDRFGEVIGELRVMYDYVVIDSGPSYTDEVIAILMVCDELIFVATPDYPTLAATVRLSKFAKFKDIKILGVLLNRVRKKRFEVGWRDVEKTVGARVIGEIREDVRMIKAVKRFDCVVGDMWSSSGKGFLKLARKIDSGLLYS